MSSKRFQVDKKNLEKVYEDLKNKGLTIREINDEIDGNFRNYLYKGYSMDEKIFQNLEELYGSSIPHERVNKKGNKKYHINSLEKNKELAELVGYILGDGNITRGKNSNYVLDFTLHEEEVELRNRIKELLEKITGIEPYDFSSGGKSHKIRISSLSLVEELEKVGLKAGNKTVNQVGVPDWVKNDLGYEKACLSGLVDTDGSIYQNKGRNVINFSNRSDPLLEDFCEMCDDLGIRTSSAGKHEVQIAAQEEVNKFLEVVNPIKSKNAN